MLVVLRARLFNADVDMSPMGDDAPHLVIPLARFTREYLIAALEFIVNEDEPEPGVAGR